MSAKVYRSLDKTDDEVNAASAETGVGGGKAVKVPLVHLPEGCDNAKVLDGVFELPPASEYEGETLEVAYRIAGFPITDRLLPHLPQEITTEHIGAFMKYMPFQFHRRFGDTYSDRVCPSSTRTAKCGACARRKDLFFSNDYKNQKLTKDAILDAGFGTTCAAVFFARVVMDGNDLGWRICTTGITNPKATKAKREYLFDRIAAAVSIKKTMAGESLPKNFHLNGSESRWIVATYTKAVYSNASDGSDAGSSTEKKKFNRSRPYWNLTGIAPVKEIEGVGKAEDIWWPEVGGVPGEEIVSPYDALNMPDAGELTAIAEAAYERLMNPKPKTVAVAQAADTGREEYAADGAVTWEKIVAAGRESLLAMAALSPNGDTETLRLVPDDNAIRRAVAKLHGITPRPVKPPAAPVYTEPERDAGTDDEDAPF